MGGRRLARRLGCAFVDTDMLLQERAGCSIAQIFRRDGEPAFRAAEHELICDLIASRESSNAVISTGGGLPCHLDSMDRMRAAGVTIYLQLSAEKLVERLHSGRPNERRPMLSGLSRKELSDRISTHLQEREPFYKRAAMIVDAQEFESQRIESVARMIEALPKSI